MSLDATLEYAVLEYPFSFWQWGHDCTAVPGADATIDEALKHLHEAAGLYTDQEHVARRPGTYPTGSCVLDGGRYAKRDVG